MREVVDKILASDKKFFFCVTGASLIFTEELMAFGGASKNVIGVYQPYAYELLRDLTHINSDEKAVSQITANRMKSNCDTFFKLPPKTIVIACTASLCRKDAERADRANEAYISIAPVWNLVPAREYHFTYNKIQTEQGSIRYMQEKTLASDILFALGNYLDEVSANS